ncbi:MAG: CofH family radical SAM protein [Bacteroidota bacterium]
MKNSLSFFLHNNIINTPDDKRIAEKILASERITPDEAFYLFTEADLGLLGIMASHIKNNKTGKTVYFIQNIHLEPTNICVCNCKFCSYSKKSGKPGAWRLTLEEISEKIKQISENINEIHITGGTHPDATLTEYIHLVKTIRSINPKIHIKAFSAAELHYVFQKENIKYEDGFRLLIQAGLGSIPGGGAETFDEEIRKNICPDKTSSVEWLNVHAAAHKSGIFSNATMLYGHIESYHHRIDHMMRLRTLQDITSGFNAFIPLKFKNQNNPMSELKEVSLLEDMRNYAVSRIFLDNFPHIKSYWPMLGKEAAQLSLSFGVDDIDGTINDSTRIYSMAGAEDATPQMHVEEITKIILDAGYNPVERNSDYSAVKN